MDDVATALTASLIIVALYVFGYQAFKRKHGPETAGPQGQKPYGVHGWLAFFIFISYFVAPVFTLGQLNGQIMEAEAANEYLAQYEPWQTYKAARWAMLIVVVAWQIHLAHRLRWTWTPASLTYARWFSFVMPVAIVLADVALAAALFGDVDAESTITAAIQGLMASCIWGLYFVVSKRCKNTYLSPKDLVPAAAAAPDLPPVAARDVPAPIPIPAAPAPMPRETAAPANSSHTQGNPGPHDQQSTDPAERLKKLNALRESGLLTEREYEAKRQEILGSI